MLLKSSLSLHPNPLLLLPRLQPIFHHSFASPSSLSQKNPTHPTSTTFPTHRNKQFFSSSSSFIPDPYQTLSISRISTNHEIKKAYYKLAQVYHPDKNQSNNAQQKFTQINNAYELLSDQVKKSEYDRLHPLKNSSNNSYTNRQSYKQSYQNHSTNTYKGGRDQQKNAYGFYSYGFREESEANQNNRRNQYQNFYNSDNFSHNYRYSNTQQQQRQQKPHQNFSYQNVFNNLFSSKKTSHPNTKYQYTHGAYRATSRPQYSNKNNNQSSSTSQSMNFMSSDIEKKISITFNEAVNGATKTLTYKRKIICTSCKGTKMDKFNDNSRNANSSVNECHQCQGMGFIITKNPQTQTILRIECQKCYGTGHIIENVCKICSGSGIIENQQTHNQVQIPKGITNGTSLKFHGKGNINGSLRLTVSIVNWPKEFIRQENNLLTSVDMDVVDAILGCKVKVKGIYQNEGSHGENQQRHKIKVDIPSGMQNQGKIVIPKMGFYKMNTQTKGDMIVTVNLKVSQRVTKEEKEIYEQILQLEKSKQQRKKQQEKVQKQQQYQQSGKTQFKYNKKTATNTSPNCQDYDDLQAQSIFKSNYKKTGQSNISNSSKRHKATPRSKHSQFVHDNKKKQNP